MFYFRVFYMLAFSVYFISILIYVNYMYISFITVPLDGLLFTVGYLYRPLVQPLIMTSPCPSPSFVHCRQCRMSKIWLSQLGIMNELYLLVVIDWDI